MSEILLYKANQCIKNLNRATENVQKEQDQLDANVDKILDEVNASFQVCIYFCLYLDVFMKISKCTVS
jgi:hypothetical protein